MTIVGVPINVVDRKPICEGAALPVATGEIVKPILKRIVGITAVVAREGRIAQASQ